MPEHGPESGCCAPDDESGVCCAGWSQLYIRLVSAGRWTVVGPRISIPAAFARGQAPLHPRLLARPPADAAADAWSTARADPHADLRPPRRPHHRRRGAAFRHRFDRRLARPRAARRRSAAMVRQLKAGDCVGITPGRAGRAGDARDRRHRRGGAAGGRAGDAVDLCDRGAGASSTTWDRFHLPLPFCARRLSLGRGDRGAGRSRRRRHGALPRPDRGALERADRRGRPAASATAACRPARSAARRCAAASARRRAAGERG